ncbi:aminotransferase class I/II-fold pyridoxal phosphate-dependent enzyme [Algoriphagus halophytocola]|uniref:Aminotransferase class I/II-fold pyridoxal phosphate-dependent enzyme n=1 Tax=Algoriphagus halophytocola TaxID=2991499 RepID=A0ABY6MER0_9BACT|nr:MULTISPECIES: aminotransferase class I/II-fold pyridoxal phosphate-dependent enzyme [unclassified Algoriphagus]UZD21643.1 aminotransferase class I/II-fold pyridoxal phosphate-dependent enzyme [Algoriphagus sp. TR-M5]WBL42855.1 aminotransferase class I/II-fold pyridoxal phosphate-dependent enzyme [Algoriphagus sp. TR-M9]
MIELEGKEYLYFSGTSYLGIAQHLDFLDILTNNLFEFGANHGQSRINNIRLQVFDEFEEEFALSAGAPAAAVLSSGYLAGMAAWKALFEKDKHTWVAPDAHSAILPDGIFPNAQLDFTQWKKDCLAQSEQLSPQKILIIGNAVDPFRCQIHQYDWVREIAKKHEVSLLIDDSHAFGVIGDSIYGTYDQWSHPSINLLVAGSLGKGLGLPAGIILGDEVQIQKIKSTALFGGASPGSPAHLQTFLQMEHLYDGQKLWLNDACGIFAQETADVLQVIGSQDFPAFVYTDDSWTRQFEKAGIITSSFPYPTPESPSVNRIVISAFHELGDIQYLNDIIHDLAQ